MIEKRLGKIDFVEFGSMKDYPPGHRGNSITTIREE